MHRFVAAKVCNGKGLRAFEDGAIMIVGVPKETFPGERRVALTPGVLNLLKKAGLEVLVETGAGDAAGYPDASFTDKGARIAGSRQEVFDGAEILTQVRSYGSNLETGKDDLALLKPGKMVFGFCDPLGEAKSMEEFAATGASLFSMELMPRITRAQSMDALSSMATVAGYKAVLLAADHLPRMFPMLMTAAGTITPAKVFILGAGVAGLQAISVAKRLGAQVTGYDIRPEAREQIESLGGKTLEIAIDTDSAQDTGGYAKEQSEETLRKQREAMSDAIAESDVLITTAAVPGKKAPVLVPADMAKRMRPGSVIVDLAAERGGNCELTEPGKTVEVGGVTVLGPTNMPAMVPYHASQMYSKNMTTFLQHLVKEGKIELDMEDEITAGTLVAKDGKVVHPMVLKVLGQAPTGTGS